MRRDHSAFDVSGSLPPLILGLLVWLLATSNHLVLKPPIAVAPMFVSSVIGVALVMGASGSEKRTSAAVLLLAPAVFLTGWTAPRGDGDGLWLLYYPLLMMTIIPVRIALELGFLLRRK